MYMCMHGKSYTVHTYMWKIIYICDKEMMKWLETKVDKMNLGWFSTACDLKKQISFW